MAYIMGVDGGGSKTYTVITNEKGILLGEGFSAGTNYQKIGLETAMTHAKQSMEQALASAGLRYEDLSFVQFALAGADRPIDVENLKSGLKRFPVRSWDLVCDTMAGLRTGSPGNIGVVLVCGSGTNAYGRSGTGKVVQTGGFGYLYGDFAGGNHMAVETFRAAVRSWELRDVPSELTRSVPAFFGFSSMEEMLDDFLDRQVSSVPSELTILLHEVAERGDQLASRLLAQTGRELGMAARSVMERIGDFGVEEIPIVLVGGVFQRGKDPQLLRALKQTVYEGGRKVRFVIPNMEPVFGAVLMGMDRLNIQAGEDVIKRFNSYRRVGVGHAP